MIWGMDGDCRDVEGRFIGWVVGLRIRIGGLGICGDEFRWSGALGVEVEVW